MENADAVIQVSIRKLWIKLGQGWRSRYLRSRDCGCTSYCWHVYSGSQAVTGGAVAAGHAGGQFIDKGRLMQDVP